jgi:hypothetical protein
LNTTKLKKKHIFHFIKPQSSIMSFPFPTFHNSYAYYFFLIDQLTHIDNHHQNPLQVCRNVFLYSLQNGYKCLIAEQIACHKLTTLCCHNDMLPHRLAYIVIPICLLCHIVFLIMSSWLVYTCSPFMSTCLYTYHILISLYHFPNKVSWCPCIITY